MSAAYPARVRAGPDARGAAFFDVDETLIRVKSMRSFLEFREAERGEGVPPAESGWERFLRETSGLPREERNRAFYRGWAGESVVGLARDGRAWFERSARESGFFLPRALDAARAHRRAGRRVFLVSGSFHACLDPIAAHVGATEVFCTELLARGGLLTGEIVRSRIGEGKRDAVETAIARYGLDRERTWGYGDHISDVPMLEAVAHPVTVNADPGLARIARDRGWAGLDAGRGGGPRG